MRAWILAAALLAAPVAAEKPSPWQDGYGETRSPTVPKKVRKFVIDAQMCAHFSGEEGYDKERAAFLKKLIDKSCPKLEERRDKLLGKYRGNAEVEAIVAEVWEPFA